MPAASVTPPPGPQLDGPANFFGVDMPYSLGAALDALRFFFLTFEAGPSTATCDTQPYCASVSIGCKLWCKFDDASPAGEIHAPD